MAHPYRHGSAASVAVRLAAALLAVLTAGPAATLPAQPVDTVRVAGRVRMTVAGDPRPITGVLTAVQQDTLVVHDDVGGTQRVLARTVTSVERSLGRSSARGARRDGVKGVLAGGVILALGGAHGMRGGDVAAAVLAWGTVGAAVGALRRPEQWQVAALPQGPPGRPTVAPGLAPPAVTPSPPSAPFPHTATALSPHDLIRLSTDTVPRLSGTVVAASRDSLLLERGGIALRYAWQDIRRLEVYDGKTPRAGGRRLGKVGAVAGGILGGLAGFGLSQLGPNAGTSKVAGGVAAMGAAGAVTGYLLAAPIGRGFPVDDWRRVPLPPP